MGKNFIKSLYYLSLGLTVITFIILISIFGRYYYERKSFFPKIKDKLTTISNDRRDKILDFIKDKQDKLKQFSTQNADLIFEKKITTKEVAAFAKKHDFKNVFLINPVGEVYFSALPSAYLDKTLSTDSLADSQLTWSFLRSIMAIAPDVSKFAIDPLTKKPALYISLPLFYEGKVGGIISAQIDHEVIFSIIADYKDLGRTGDIIMAVKNKDAAELITPNRFYHKKTFETIPFEGKKLPIELAVLGEYGTGIKKDFRDIEIIAHWQYIIIVDWGIVVKIDYYEGTQILRFYFILLWIIGLLFLSFTFLAVFLKRTLNKS